MSMQFVKNGKISGWVFASIATILYMLVWVMAFISDAVSAKMEINGEKANWAYLTVIGVWMATKTAKSILTTNKTTSPSSYNDFYSQHIDETSKETKVSYDPTVVAKETDKT